MTGSDGGVVSESFYAVEDSSNPFKGLVYRIGYADGSVVEKLWRTNNLREVDTQGSSSANPYVKSEYSSIRDAGGNLTKTAIKDYNYDKNGNVTRVKEYDWAAYGSVHDGSGSPLWDAARPAIKRDTVNAYYRATPDAADWTTSDPDAYHQPTAPRLRAALSSSEVSDGLQAVSRTELYYDESATTGNLIGQRSWDSYKGGTYKAITRPLGAGGADNYVSVSHEYDENAADPALRYGNRTLSEDARGNKTKFTYGPVNGVVAGLYPTEVRAAYGTAVEQVTTAQYDFGTGLVTRATDPNGVSSETIYDAFGRPTWVKRAVNTPAESHTRVIYSDVERRVITRSNLSSLSDAKLVSVEHYDQLGRGRLTRKLENSTALITDAPAAAEADESVGIKVQARYFSANPCQPQNTAECVAANGQSMASYQLVSNPYRAATSAAASAEATMGWARSKSDRSGRVVEAETFAGSALPAPWAADPSAANTASTGKVLTSYDAENTTVTDQQGKPRRSVTDALGRLLRVDEPTAAGLGAPSAPNQPTCYAYDTLSNLTGVRQGGGWQAGQCQNSPQADRAFQYSSLSRLTSASNPEGGVVNYTYYDDGSLKTKADARGVTATYLYDELGRVTSRAYTAYTTAQGETVSTPSVSYFYDSQSPTAAGAPTLDRGLSKGRLVAVTYEGGADGTYLGGYDAAGRVTKSVQRTDGQVYSFPSYAYDLAGNLTSQTYPSGRVVATEYDAAGRFAGVKHAGAGRYWAGGSPGAKAVSYAAHGALSGVRLGNGLWEGTGFNSRLQPTSISLDAKSRTTTVPKSLVLRYTYGLTVDGTLDATKNNGNVESQTVIIPDPADQRNDLLRVTQAYEYDEVNRLASARETTASTGAQAWRQVYSYDRFGNRTLAGGTSVPALPPGEVDAYWNPSVSQTNNRLDSPGYGYDPAGNLTAKPGAVAGTTDRSVYDAENRMVTYKHDQTAVAEYRYDGDGRRVKKAAGGAATVFVYDALGKLVAEYSTAQPATNGTQYLTADNLGSPRIVTDARGSVKARHDYFPFGEEIGAGIGGRTTNQGYVGNADGVRQGFTGYEEDAETGLNYAQARYHSPTVARFTSPDPLLSSGRAINPGTWNRYAYALNNPLKFIDPTGLFEWDASLSESGATDEKDKKRRAKLRSAFTNARDKARADAAKAHAAGKLSDEKLKKINNALDAYGAEGQRNGVTVGVGTKNGNPGSTDPVFEINESYTGVTPMIGVKFDEKFLQSDSASVVVAHEGAHVEDAFTFANAYPEIRKLGAGIINDQRNMTQWVSENNAFHVQSYLFEAMGKNDSKWGTWQNSWVKLDAQQQRQQAIANAITSAYGFTRGSFEGQYMNMRTCRPCK